MCRFTRHVLVRYALLNVPLTAVNDVHAKKFPRITTHSDHEYTIFAPAHLSRNWYRQRPSYEGDLDWSITGEVGSVYYTGVELSVDSLLCHSK